MIINLKLVKIDTKYCDYLRQFDGRVAYNKNDKKLRPFIGILFNIETMEYFAPLTSPKPKHLKMKNTLDFYKIDGGKLGAINFNNMIPVKQNNYKLVDLDKIHMDFNDKKYQKMLKEQLRWLNENFIEVKNKSYKLYDLYYRDKLPKTIKARCCNFKLLENICNKYNVG